MTINVLTSIRLKINLKDQNLLILNLKCKILFVCYIQSNASDFGKRQWHDPGPCGCGYFYCEMYTRVCLLSFITEYYLVCRVSFSLQVMVHRTPFHWVSVSVCLCLSPSVCVCSAAIRSPPRQEEWYFQNPMKSFLCAAIMIHDAWHYVVMMTSVSVYVHS